MRPTRVSTRTIRTTGSFAWLGVFAVLLFQAQFALHPQAEHEISPTADFPCEVCLQLDSSGNAPIAEVVAQPLVPATPESIPGANGISSTLVVVPYGARAPPKS